MSITTANMSVTTATTRKPPVKRLSKVQALSAIKASISTISDSSEMSESSERISVFNKDLFTKNLLNINLNLNNQEAFEKLNIDSNQKTIPYSSSGHIFYDLKVDFNAEYIPLFLLNIRFDHTIPFELFGTKNLSIFEKYLDNIDVPGTAFKKVVDYFIDNNKLGYLLLLNKSDYSKSFTEIKETMLERIEVFIKQVGTLFLKTSFTEKSCISTIEENFFKNQFSTEYLPSNKQYHVNLGLQYEIVADNVPALRGCSLVIKKEDFIEIKLKILKGENITDYIKLVKFGNFNPQGYLKNLVSSFEIIDCSIFSKNVVTIPRNINDYGKKIDLFSKQFLNDCRIKQGYDPLFFLETGETIT